jgi:hypothetical protein
MAFCPGLTGKVEFSLHYRGLLSKVQILLIDADFAQAKQSFTSYVLGSFDISAAKCSLVLPCENIYRPTIKFLLVEDEMCTLQGCMKYTMSAYTPPAFGAKRLLKYRRRGFKLASLSYEPSMPQILRLYFLDQLRRLLVPLFVDEMLEDSFGRCHGIDVTCYASVIRGFLGKPGYVFPQDKDSYRTAQQLVRQWPPIMTDEG